MVYQPQPGPAQPNLHAYLNTPYHAWQAPSQHVAPAAALTCSLCTQQLGPTPNINQAGNGPAFVSSQLPPHMQHSESTGNASAQVPDLRSLPSKEQEPCNIVAKKLNLKCTRFYGATLLPPYASSSCGSHISCMTNPWWQLHLGFCFVTTQSC